MSEAVHSSQRAGEITRKSGSNLALSFLCLPRDRRHDMETFYAFCREVDDIADDLTRAVEERKAALGEWRLALRGSPSAHQPEIAPAVRSLLSRRGIPVALLDDILTGMEMDLGAVRYQTFAELEKYCYHVAGAVGLASLRIFGADPARSEAYARKLGLGLQLTNILRDIGEDLRDSDRIYVPAEELARFGLSESDLRKAMGGRRDTGSANTDGVRALLEFQAERAARTLEETRALLPAEDRQALKAPELMRAMYTALLVEMRRDGLKVLEKRYRLGWSQKLRVLLFGR